MPRKLIIVCNPQSSRHDLVQKEVVEPARKLAGWMVGKYLVTADGFEANVMKLAKILTDGDLVIAAGGDGTATMTVNSIMQSQKAVILGVLGYGNFNDLAKTLKTRRWRSKGARSEGGVQEIIAALKAGKTQQVWPLDIKVDGRHWRYATGYLTLGLFAESTEVFDEVTVRKKLQSGKRSVVFSWWNLVKWYFKNRKKRDFVPAATLNGEKVPQEVTDYVAVNGPWMAGVMRGGDWYLQPKGFGRAVGRLGSFWRLSSFMMKSILRQVPMVETERDVLKFAQPSDVEVQAEGEYQRFKQVEKIEVTKAERTFTVVQL